MFINNEVLITIIKMISQKYGVETIQKTIDEMDIVFNLIGEKNIKKHSEISSTCWEVLKECYKLEDSKLENKNKKGEKKEWKN